MAAPYTGASMTGRVAAQVEKSNDYKVLQHVVITELERKLNEERAKGWTLKFVEKEATSVYFLIFEK